LHLAPVVKIAPLPGSGALVSAYIGFKLNNLDHKD